MSVRERENEREGERENVDKATACLTKLSDNCGFSYQLYLFFIYVRPPNQKSGQFKTFYGRNLIHVIVN